MTKSIAVLMACYNRASVTRTCLSKLTDQKGDFKTRVYLVDDNSADDTARVAKSFDFVEYIKGTGHLFWNGGMHLAWVRAHEDAPDLFLWLNDDVTLDDGAIRTALRVLDELEKEGRTAILVGATRSAEGEVSYSGFDLSGGRWNFRLSRKKESAALQSCDTFNGNFVLIPSAVQERLGFNDPSFLHSYGDIDYGLRAKKAGIERLVLPRTVGVCEPNTAKATAGWGSLSLSLAERWRLVNRPLGLPWRSWLRFTIRHCGPYWPVVFIRQYLYLIGLDRRLTGRLRRSS